MGGKPEWWFSGAIGIILMVIAWVSFSINTGIRANGSYLREVGKRIGDESIPDVSNKWKASSHWIAIFVLVIGLFCLSHAVFELVKIIGGCNA
jgi:uncharacterized membrane protein YiaA